MSRSDMQIECRTLLPFPQFVKGGKGGYGSIRRFFSNLCLWRSISWVEYGGRPVTGRRTLTDFAANLQVFCRYNAGNGYPVSVYLYSSFVRGEYTVIRVAHHRA